MIDTEQAWFAQIRAKTGSLDLGSFLGGDIKVLRAGQTIKVTEEKAHQLESMYPETVRCFKSTVQNIEAETHAITDPAQALIAAAEAKAQEILDRANSLFDAAQARVEKMIQEAEAATSKKKAA